MVSSLGRKAAAAPLLSFISSKLEAYLLSLYSCSPWMNFFGDFSNKQFTERDNCCLENYVEHAGAVMILGNW